LKPGNKIFGSQKESEKDDIFDDDVDLSFLENNEDEEQKLIEERRKRRQAILSKFSSKDSMSSLNTSSIASSTVADETPVAHPKSSDDQNGKNSCSKNVNVSAPPPSLSHSNSPAPFNLAKECTEKQPSVKSPAASDPESESSVFAADYDPTQDEREDDLRKIKGKTTGAPHPHKTQSELDILRSKDHDEQVKKTNNVDDADMFAADYSEVKSKNGVSDNLSNDIDMFNDEIDMFAEDSQIDHQVTGTAEVRIIQNTNLADNWDDQEGYYRFMYGELLDNRYLVFSSLGKGVFSTVVKAKDKKKDDRVVAIKIIRNNETMYKAGIKEQQILEKLMKADPDGKKHVVYLYFVNVVFCMRI